MSHDPQIAHTQNSFLPENSNSLMAFTRPSRNSPLPLHPQFQPVTCTNSSFQRHQQNYIHLNTPYCYTSSSPYTCYFWYWNYHPFSQFLLQMNSYPLWKRATRLQCFHEPSKQLTSTPLCQPYVMYSIIAFIILHCNNLSTFSHQSVSSEEDLYIQLCIISNQHKKCSIKAP